jgi:hypothetical protein
MTKIEKSWNERLRCLEEVENDLGELTEKRWRKK